MIFGKTENNPKVKALPGLRAYCPVCDGELIAKCGKVKIWHWAHVTAECDAWTEPETEWHRRWKSLWPDECVEVTIKRDGVLHRADILTPKGVVIELQHSAISISDIKERESFYGNMVWLFDLIEPFNAGRLQIEKIPYWQDSQGLYACFAEWQEYEVKWLSRKKSLGYIDKPLWVDVHEAMYWVTNNHEWKNDGKIEDLSQVKATAIDWRVQFGNLGNPDYQEAYMLTCQKWPEMKRAYNQWKLLLAEHVAEQERREKIRYMRWAENQKRRREEIDVFNREWEDRLARAREKRDIEQQVEIQGRVQERNGAGYDLLWQNELEWRRHKEAEWKSSGCQGVPLWQWLRDEAQREGRKPFSQRR